MKKLFPEKPKHTHIVGDNIFTMMFYENPKIIRENYLHVFSKNKTFELKVRGFAYGYLLAAYRQKRYTELDAFCYVMYRITDGVYQDGEFAEDVIKALTAYDERKIKEARKDAEEVTEGEEIANQALMEEVVEDISSDKKTRAKRRKQWKEDVKEIITKPDEEDNH